MALNIATIQAEFPLLSAGHTVYLDSAATAQKPQCVIDAIKRFYENDNANVHRGMHPLAERATVAYEEARESVQSFLNAAHPEEIIFTKSCTEAINIVAHGYIQKGDSICLSILEHHSNIISWMQAGATLHWIDIEDSGEPKLEELEASLIQGNIKLVAITGQSNVLGVRPPLQKIIELSHAAGAKVLIDAAQLVAHHPIDVQDLDCDFLTFSGHKLYGPMGIGVLYGKRELLDSMSPLLGGVDVVFCAAFSLEARSHFHCKFMAHLYSSLLHR